MTGKRIHYFFLLLNFDRCFSKLTVADVVLGLSTKTLNGSPKFKHFRRSTFTKVARRWQRFEVGAGTNYDDWSKSTVPVALDRSVVLTNQTQCRCERPFQCSVPPTKARAGRSCLQAAVLLPPPRRQSQACQQRKPRNCCPNCSR